MKFAVLGLGSIGARHAKNLSDIGQEVIGYDPEIKNEYRKPSKIDDRLLLANTEQIAIEEADAVIIASPNQYHADSLREVVAAGKHVLVEKPIGARFPRMVSNALKMAQEKKLVVMTGYNLRFCENVIQAKRLLDSGQIGKPIWASVTCGSYLPDWRPDVDYKTRYSSDKLTGGCIFDISHEIDLALYLLGPAEVSSATATCTGILGLECEDIADALLTHESGCRTVLHVDYLTKPPIRSTTIVGTLGQITIDLNARWGCLVFANGAPLHEKTFTDTFDENYVSELKAFITRIQGGHALGATGEDGLAAMKIALKMRKLAGLP